MTDVDIYCEGIQVDEPRRQELFRVLSEDERERAGRFHFDIHRERFIAARGILREILGRSLGIDPGLIQFSYGPHGKPFIEGTALRFNVSHTAGLAMYAVSTNREVGVDIERVNPAFAHEQIPERFFSPAEVAALRALPEGKQTEAFFRCWTRKEAYVKARGAGLSLDLKSFDVSLDGEEPAQFLRGADGWSVESVDPAPGFIAALVAEDLAS